LPTRFATDRLISARPLSS